MQLFTTTITEKDQKIDELQNDLRKCNESIKSKSLDISKLNDTVEERNKSMTKLQDNINQMNKDIEDQTLKHINEIGDKNARINAISTELKSVQNNLADHEKLVKKLNLQLTISEDTITKLEKDIAKKEQDFVAKEKELNLLYETKLGEANNEIREKEEILKNQSEKLSDLQNDLLKARESGEAKDLEIYEKNYEITKLNKSLEVAQNDISLKVNELEEKNTELLNIREALKMANSDNEDKDKQIEVN